MTEKAKAPRKPRAAKASVVSDTDPATYPKPAKAPRKPRSALAEAKARKAVPYPRSYAVRGPLVDWLLSSPSPNALRYASAAVNNGARVYNGEFLYSLHATSLRPFRLSSRRAIRNRIARRARLPSRQA